MFILKIKSFLKKDSFFLVILMKRFQKIDHDYKDRLIFTIIREPYNHLISHIFMGKESYTRPPRFKVHPQVVQDLALKLDKINFENAAEVEEFVNQIDGYALAAFENRQIRYFVDPPDAEWTNSSHKSEAIEMAKQLFTLVCLRNLKIQ